MIFSCVAPFKRRRKKLFRIYRCHPVLPMPSPIIGKITLSANQIKVLEVGMANMKEH
jgi:hypothetical protein